MSRPPESFQESIDAEIAALAIEHAPGAGMSVERLTEILRAHAEELMEAGREVGSPSRAILESVQQALQRTIQQIEGDIRLMKDLTLARDQGKFAAEHSLARDVRQLLEHSQLKEDDGWPEEYR